MSANQIEQLTKRIETLELLLITKHKDKLTIKELSELTPYSESTIYKKKKLMTLGVHYSYSNGKNGKLIFDKKAIDFLNKGENENGESLHEKRQSVCLDQFLTQ